MQISLRSQLVAGAVAVVGASAVAIAPIAQQGVELPGLGVHSTEVALSAFANPFYTVLSSMNLVVNDVFNPYDHYAPFAMLQGMIPQAIADHLPVASQFGNNLSLYTGSVLQNLFTSPTSTASVISIALWDLPSSLLTAAQQVLSGDFSGAVTTLYNAIIAPIPYAIDPIVSAIQTVVGGVVGNALNVVGAIPGLVSSLINTTVVAIETLTGVAFSVGNNVLSNLASLNFEGAWNAYINGAWGPSGFAGYLEALTIGPGIGIWPTQGYLSSFRVWGQGAVYTLANALGASYIVPAAAVAPGAAARTAAAVTAGEASSSEGLSGSAEESSEGPSSGGLSSGADESTGPVTGGNAASSLAGDNNADGDAAGDAAGGSVGARDSAAADSTAGDAKTGAHRAGGSAKSGGSGHAKSHGAARKAS